MAPALPPTSTVSTPTPQEQEASTSGRPRPALLWGIVHGLLAVAGPLVLAGVLGVASWFLSDAGAHGSASDGVRHGAMAWLVGHGSGFMVDGVAVTVVPLLLTAGLAWWVWRCALGLGERVWAHGPDVHRLSDGERDWTVPAALLGFGVAYLASLLVVVNLASGPTFDPLLGRVLLWTLVLVLGVGAPGVATGSGRAAGWVSQLPPVVRHAVVAARRVLVWWLVVCLVVLVAALGLGLGQALEMVDSLGLSGAEALQLVLLNVGFAPNAVLMTSAFLLGPGFAVGVGTVVSPTVVTLGPLPLLPLLAALPEAGTPSAWWGASAVVAVAVAAWAAWRHQGERPTLRWDEGALRGCGAGLVAAALLTLLTAVAGGAAGPGRLREVGAQAGEVGLHAVVWLGLGALAGGLAITWWQRRTSVPLEDVVVEEPPTPVGEPES
ncbi:DUF6350 family protein [Nocardioides jishulii]|uniref:Uncharacterized protein n=1 Tax=Nocardioides jishulii TaxID=2575440 RepID=A0A4U2YVL0_9ACTN|nr:DUF6350 family protein [Nocardioides jishulii]QCX28325.1 hypothetical protein FCL41_12950 [Nocardioides jishulii]TKI64782.1 hypothetical protein FC770_06625 [Nocardioides jishulii]